MEINRPNLAFWYFAWACERVRGVKIVPVDDFPSIRRLEGRIDTNWPAETIFSLWSLGWEILDLFLEEFNLPVSHVDFDFWEAFVQFVNFGGSDDRESGDSFFK